MSRVNVKNLLCVGFMMASALPVCAQNGDEKSVEMLKESLAYTLHYESERIGNARDQQYYIDLVAPVVTKILELPVSIALLDKQKEKRVHLAVVGQTLYDLVQVYIGTTRTQYEKVLLFKERVVEVLIKKYSDEIIDVAQNAHEIVAILDGLVQEFYREKRSFEERVQMAVLLSEAQRSSYGEKFLSETFSDEDVNKSARHIFHGIINDGKNRWIQIPGPGNKWIQIPDEV
jgi:hypothetical protein